MEELPQSPEQQHSPEHSAELAEMAAEKQAEKAEVDVEAVAEKQHENLEKAREKIEYHAEQPAKEEAKKPAGHHPTRLDKLAAYRETMASVRRRLSPEGEAFSKVVHHPAVEKTSEVVGSTVLRPSVALGATSTACIVGGILYLTARRYGFALSGSEFLLALAAGAIIGLAIEGLTKLIRRARTR